MVTADYKDSLGWEYVESADEMFGFGKVKVTPLNMKPGKTVSVKLQVYQVGQATNSKPATVTLKVKTPK